jgi:hypothetical protein
LTPTDPGGLYDPLTPPANSQCSMCWTGNAILLWGGANGYAVRIANEEDDLYEKQEEQMKTPYSFDPLKNIWEPLPSRETPPAQFNCLTVWSGKEMIVWNKEGFAYNPKNFQWRKLPPCEEK